MSNFDELFAQAEAELDGNVGNEDADLPGEGETDPQETSGEDVAGEGVDSSETTTDDQGADEDLPWYEDRLDEEINYKGRVLTMRQALDEGLMRADYTRKTQEVADIKKKAEWADAFLDRIQADPQKAVRDLAVQLRLIDETADAYDPEDVSPQFAQLHALNQKVEELTLANREAAVRAEWAETAAKYPDFNANEILPLVVEYGNRGIGLSIEEGYLLWKGQQAAKAPATPAPKNLQKIVEDKRKQAQQVQRGRSPAATTTEDPKRYRGMSFEDIFEEAADELGYA